MKKIISLVLVAVAATLALSFTGCASSDYDADADVSYEDSLSVLTAVWEALPDEARFSAFGGDADSAVSDAPGAHSLEALDSLAMFGIPADIVSDMEDAGTVMHAMNSNTLSAIACRFAEGADLEAAADAICAELENKQWLCGCPDKYVIAKVADEYLVVVYGVNDVVGPFVDAMGAYLMGCEVIVDAPLA